jgi:VanZ family protein
MTRHRSSATLLAWMLAGIIVYASLYPFSGWRIPGVSPWAFLSLPWPKYWTTFDVVANLLGYFPLGALAFGAAVRTGHRTRFAVALGLGAGFALSFTMEWLQNFLPLRVSSNLDLFLNVAGTGLGVAAGALIHKSGALNRWQAVRERWFIARSAGGLSLLCLWPLGLLFPTPVPLGLGQVLTRLRDTAQDWLQGTALEIPAAPWLHTSPEAATSVLAPGGEFAVTVMGLLAPCLLAFSISKPGWRRSLLVLGLAAAAVAASTLSTALNFGPQHAMAWQTDSAVAAFLAAIVTALLLAWVPPRAAAALGLMALTALVALVAQAPADPYFADSLQAWEQGRFIRFHGAAHWVGWLWPYAALAYLLARIGAPEQ